MSTSFLFVPHVMLNRLRTGKKLGYSLHLDGNQLVVETQSKIGKRPQVNPVNFNLQFNKVGNSTELLHKLSCWFIEFSGIW